MNRWIPLSLTVVLLLGMVVFFSGCAHKPAIPLEYSQDISQVFHPPEDLVKNLDRYWSLRSQGQLENAYEMEAPYIREITPFSMYSKILGNTPTIQKIKVINVRAVSNVYYEITLTLFLEIKDGQSKTSSLVDKWVLVKDTWTHVIKDPVFREYFP